MRKTFSVLLACLMLLALFSACKSVSPSPSDSGGVSSSPSDVSSTPSDTSEIPGVEASEAPADSNLPEGTEMRNGKIYFTETRTVSVRLYERNTAVIAPDKSPYGLYVKEGVLRDHNINVEYFVQPRDDEVTTLNNVLADKSAPGICYTYDYPTVLTYAKMGGVIDLYPLVTENKAILPNMWSLLGETYIYLTKDPVTNTLWSINGIYIGNRRTNTFARQDWMEKLQIAEPKSIDEFEAMLYAFRDNAETLMGADASKMIPYAVDYDIGWKVDHLANSFVPEATTEKERYVRGFDDRHLLYPGAKEAYQKLNDWFLNGLVWRDFVLTRAGDKEFGNILRAGYVGAFGHNWDEPYRDIASEGGSIDVQLKRNTGNDAAAYIAIEPFKNDAGIYRKYLPAANDRQVFFPVFNNTEPLASMVYLDWTCDPANYTYLQIGQEGINYTKNADGTITPLELSAENAKYGMVAYNIDFTMLMNGLNLTDPVMNASGAMANYPGATSEQISLAMYYTQHDAVYSNIYSFGEILSEEGMGPVLNQKRDELLMQSIAADAGKFDSVWDSGMADYLNSGGQAIIEERTAAWEKYLGNATSMG